MKDKSLPSRLMPMLAVCGSLSAAGGAHAQDASSAQPAADSQSADVTEIIVTAQKIEAPISKTPVAITAISADDLQKANVNNAVQLQYLAPSMGVTQTGQGVYVSIRGVTTTDQTSKGEPGIQFNTDGIPVSRAEEQAIGFFDLQRVEVLAGPQGTLYGKSSTGGAINVITNAPKQETEAYASVELGNYNTKRLEGMFNTPLTDKIAFRAAVSANYRDGYVTQIGGGALNDSNDKLADENNVVGRFSLLGQFTDDTSLRLTYLDGRIGGAGFGDGRTGLTISPNRELHATTESAWNPISPYIDDEFQKGYGEFNTAFGPVRLTYLGSYSRYSTNNNQTAGQFYDPQNDPNGSATEGARLLVTDTYDTTYHELRFSNRDEGKLQWIAGFNYWWENTHENGHAWKIAETTDCPQDFSAYCTILDAGGDPAYQNIHDLYNTTTHKTISAFAHAVYALTPAWHLTAGAREGRDEIARNGTIAANWFQIGPNTPSTPTLYPSLDGSPCINTDICVPQSGNIINNSGNGKSTKLVWTIGTDYQFTESQFGYATIATGYKAGGFNDVDPNTGKFGPYAPESMIAYELGYKVHVPRGLSYTSSLYYYDYSNEQINTNVLVGGSSFGLTLGVPTQLYGWENSVKWSATKADLISLGLNFEHSKYVDFLFTPTNSFADGNYGTGEPVDLTGKELDNTPKAIASLGYSHTWTFASGSTLELHADTRWSSSYVLTQFQTGQQYHQGDFTRSNAGLSYITSDGKLQTDLFVTNIEDKLQVTGSPVVYSADTQFPTGYSVDGYGNVSQPRFFGVRQSIRF